MSAFASRSKQLLSAARPLAWCCRSCCRSFLTTLRSPSTSSLAAFTSDDSLLAVALAACSCVRQRSSCDESAFSVSRCDAVPWLHLASSDWQSTRAARHLVTSRSAATSVGCDCASCASIRAVDGAEAATAAAAVGAAPTDAAGGALGGGGGGVRACCSRCRLRCCCRLNESACGCAASSGEGGGVAGRRPLKERLPYEACMPPGLEGASAGRSSAGGSSAAAQASQLLGHVRRMCSAFRAHSPRAAHAPHCLA
mmetsp:Transcript_19940/g.47780  ORF Transcript_19940/g.47780 Transcript_19940/m.47780 type:complete len:254 (+) Transcript_19940:632-1393(+)